MMYARDHGLIATPIGLIRVEGDDNIVTRVRIGAEGPARSASASAVRTALEQLEAYFSGNLRHFTVPLSPPGTDRGMALRGGLIAVGYGETMSYGELARHLASAPRAIGQLCARNPLPIIVPCHRILGAGGALGHYSAGDGAMTKQWLLDHERQHLSGDK